MITQLYQRIQNEAIPCASSALHMTSKGYTERRQSVPLASTTRLRKNIAPIANWKIERTPNSGVTLNTLFSRPTGGLTGDTVAQSVISRINARFRIKLVHVQELVPL